MDHSTNDEILLEAIGQGSHMAFATLVTRHTRRFYNIAYRTLRHKEAAEDIVQDAFLKLWQKPRLFNVHKHVTFTTWFYRVVINLCLDHNKKKRPYSTQNQLSDYMDNAPDAGKILDTSRLQLLLEKKILELPKRQQIALNLCFYEGLSNQEAADIMKINLKALQSLIMRAKSNLKKALYPLLYEDSDYDCTALYDLTQTHYSHS